MLILTNKVKATRLRNSAVAFVADHAEEVLQDDQWKMVEEENAQIVTEVCLVMDKMLNLNNKET